MKLLVALLLLICISLTATLNLKGHLQPLGQQGDGAVLKIDKVDGFPKPKEFVENFVIKNKPVLMKNAAKISPAWSKWTDEYLAKNAPPSPEGDIAYEEGKKENRSDGQGIMHMSKFIEKYNHSDIYMVHDIPEWMMKDLTVPGSLQCDGFMNGGLDTTVMWFSSGGTSSVVHNDPFENINCIYRGSKTLVFINPNKFKHLLPQILLKDSHHHKLDVDKVDLKKFPVFSKLEYHIAHMKSGDCLYIPYLWLHQVRSFNESNLAVNVWWSRGNTKKTDLTKCKDQVDPSVTFDKVEWVHREAIRSNFAYMRQIYKTFETNVKNHGEIDEEEFIKYVVEGCSQMIENKLVYTILSQMFHLLDKNKNKNLDRKDFSIKNNLKFYAKFLTLGNKFDMHLEHMEEKFPEKCHGLYFFMSSESRKSVKSHDEL